MIDVRESNRPLFSIIVPCYNCDRYLGSCLSSIVSQTFSSWEIIAIDDGSTDGTYEMLEGMKSRLKDRMHIIRQENAGQLKARNKATLVASGEYLLFVDSDDEIRIDALAILSSYISEHPGLIIQFKASKDRQYAICYAPVYSEEIEFPAIVDIKQYRRWLCQSNDFNNVWGKAVPKALFDRKADLSKYEDFRNGEDLLQVIGMIEDANEILLVEDILYYYRTNDSSVTHGFRPDFFDAILAVNSFLYDQITRWDDDVCTNLFWKRWIRSSCNYLSYLSRSDYSISDLRSELEKVSRNGLFKEAFSHEHGDGIVNRVLLIMLSNGYYTMLAALIRIKGVLLRGRAEK